MTEKLIRFKNKYNLSVSSYPDGWREKRRCGEETSEKMFRKILKLFKHVTCVEVGRLGVRACELEVR